MPMSSRKVLRALLPQMMTAIVASLSVVAASHALPLCNGGGRIVNAATLSLSNCIITGNSTADSGGGVSNTGTLTLTGVVITGNQSGMSGGGIYNAGTMTLVDVTVMNNAAGTLGGGIHNDGGTLYVSRTTVGANSAGTGGGIANTSTETLGSIIGTAIAVSGNAAITGGGVANGGGSVSLADATIDGNRAQVASAAGGDGGGIWNTGTTAATRLLRVTLSNNIADGNGGGVFNDGGSVSGAATEDDYATNITISGNSAAGAGGASFAINGATTSFRSATIADNSTAADASVVNADATSIVELGDTLLARNGLANCAGAITSAGNNLDTGATCAFAAVGDISNVGDANVGLGALADNGGPAQGSVDAPAAMETHALASTSLAVDNGSAACPGTDQRGVVRPVDGNGDSTAGCDIGAFELQVVPPPIIDTKPTNPSSSGLATFTFHDAMPGVTFVCWFDDGSVMFPLCPSGVSYNGLAEGAHTFSVTAWKDGKTSAPTTYRWRIDSTPPNATIDSGPADPSKLTTATFTFHSEPGATFQCKLDGASFVPCSSGQTYSSLGDGEHVFLVSAIDAAGNIGTAARRLWTIDTALPETTIDNGPAARTNSTTATFTFHSEAGATFQCSLDGGSFAPCSRDQCSPIGTDFICVQTYSSLQSDRSHNFQVRAVDIAGNIDATPATYDWFIDTTPPDVTIALKPSDPSNSPTPTFVFSSEPGASFLCALDFAPFVSCPQFLTVLDPLTSGPHTLRVTATDSVGNTNPTPVSYTWVVDLVPPNTTIDSGPDNPSNSTDATFTFHSDDLGSTFQCSLDGAPFVSCGSGQTYGALGGGAHNFRVRAIDIAGNLDPTPATYDWSINTSSSYDQLSSIAASLGSYASNPKVKKAIDSINKALAVKYWADGNTLTNYGQAVFNFAYDAVQNLLGVTSPPASASAARSAIASLVIVCRDLAAAAIQYAIDHAGDSKEIAAAQKEMTAAQSDLNKGKPDSAVTHYGNAWLHARKAVN